MRIKALGFAVVALFSLAAAGRAAELRVFAAATG